MSAENNFKETMKQRSNAELIEIVTRYKDDYQPAAIEAAQLEIQSRNLSLDELKTAEKEAAYKQEEEEKRVAAPLETKWKLLCMFFPGVINFYLAFIFKGEGHDKKFKEVWKWTFIGFGIYIGLFLLLFATFSLLL